MKLNKSQKIEIERCAVDFPYFCRTYCKIICPRTHGFKPFILYPYQERLYNHLEDHRMTIFSKFRQGGFTTMLAVFCLWKCLFRLDENILWISATDQMAADVCQNVFKKILLGLPNWMCGTVSKMTNDTQKSFPDNGCNIYFTGPTFHMMASPTLTVIDEASFISDMDRLWKTLWPMISTGERVVIMSTVTTDDDWFYDRLLDAKLNIPAISYASDRFVPYSCHYKEKPEFDNAEWEKDMRRSQGYYWETQYEQKPKKTDSDEETPSQTLQKTHYRSISDDWDGDMELALGAKESV